MLKRLGWTAASAMAGLALAAAVVGGAGAAETAREYPSRPIRMLVPFTPGGGTDVVTRIVAQRLSILWKSPVIVENMPGAGGINCFTTVARAAPDGYTLGVMTPTQVIAPYQYSKLPFDPMKDFAPVVVMNKLQLVLAAGLKFPPNTIQELIAYAKAHPGQVNFGSTGVGGSAHLAVELLKSMAGIDMTHVPYKGSAPAYTDLMSNQIQLLSNNIISTIPLVKNKQLKMLAVMGGNRSPVAPDVPTVAESGLPGYDVSSWFALVAPAGTPKEIVEKINLAVNQVTHDPATRKLMLDQGAEVPDGSNTPEDMARLMRSDAEKMSAVIKSAGIKPVDALQ
jgi:tripartite-type tricarboxylate transporter receptor subunit TctC